MFCKLESAVFVLSLLAALQCSAGIKANRLRDEKGGLQSQRNSTSESTSPLKGHNVHTSRLVKGKNHDTTNDISLEAVPVTSNGRTISRDTTAKLGGLHAKPTGEKNFDTSKRQDIPLGGDPADYGLQSYQFATSNQGDPSELPLEGENALVHEMTGDPQEMSRLPQPYPFADSSPTWDESDPIADPSADEPIGKRNYFAPRPGEDYKVTHVHVFHPPNPCKSGGIAVKSPYGYHCLCARGFHGRFCDEKLYCSSSPCQNGGSCEEMADNYRCRCQSGFVGYNCEERDFCLPNPCKNEGTCYETASGYKCLCRSGFTGTECEDIDYCDPNPCLNGGVCERKRGTHECLCKSHYKGKTCAERKICYSNPCRNGGRCMEENAQAPCICPQGYTHPFCKDHVCSSMPCKNGGKCSARREDDSWHFHCKCPPFFRGQQCELPNPCVAHPCLNGGSCIDTFSRYSGFPVDWDVGYLHYYCSCPLGFSGQNCQENTCAHCDSNATCIHGRCVCNRGFHGNGLTCTELRDPCQPNPCLNNGTCSIGPDQSFDCECPKGFSPPLCQEISDPCKPNPCRNHGTCVPASDQHGYHCICPGKFLQPDCEHEPEDPCASYPCKNGGTCHASEDGKSFTCVCKTDLFVQPHCDCGCPKGSAHSVPPVFPASCAEDGSCYCPSVPGKSEMVFITGKGCTEQRANPCANSPCKNGGTCAPTADGLSYRCQCPAECTGENCQTCDVSKICTAHYCKNGGTCIVVQHKARCLCPPGFLPPLCGNEIGGKVRHPCHPNPCQNGGTCRPMGRGHECICSSQFEGVHCGKDKCQHCDVHATCHNGRCTCRHGYTGSGHRGDCFKESYCEICPANAFCRHKECACIDGFYLLNGQCLRIPHPY